MREEPATDLPSRRAHARLRLGVPARLLSLDGEQWVMLMNLSQGGAGVVLSASSKIRGGVLRWLEFETYGDPAWQRGEALALHFDRPLHPRWLVETRTRAPEELDCEILARQAAQEWVSGRRIGLGTAGTLARL